MKIGFDLDGVLADQNVPDLYMMGKLSDEDRQIAEHLYYITRVPLLNPSLLMAENDEGIIVTGRAEYLRETTMRWCKKFLPRFRVFFAPTPHWKDFNNLEEWREEVAKRKAVVLNSLELDIYVEDLPETVEHLRKLCPDIKIIQYGGRLK